MSRSAPRRRFGAVLAAKPVLAVLVALVVLAMAAFAGVQSYTHIFGIARQYGAGLLDARLLPLSVDGIIVMAGVVLLWFRLYERVPVPHWVRGLLWAGIGATALANIGAGVLANFDRGPLAMAIGSVAYGWPAPAFVGTAELAFLLAGLHAEPSGSRELVQLSQAPPSSAREAAAAAYRRSLEAGNPWKPWALHTRFGISRREAGQVILEEREKAGQL